MTPTNKERAYALVRGVTRDTEDQAPISVVAEFVRRIAAALREVRAEERAEERERCARVAQAHRCNGGQSDDNFGTRCGATLADAIRRGEVRT